MSLFAVFQTGGKQYRAKPGDFVQIEKLAGDVGGVVQFDQVLLTASGGESDIGAEYEGSATPERKSQDKSEASIQLGKPYLSGATVSGEIVGQGRGSKILIIKMKRRKNYRRTKGHRQDQTQVLVTGIQAGAQVASLPDAEKSELIKKFYTHLTPRVKKVVPPLRGASSSPASDLALDEVEAPVKKAAATKAPKETPKEAKVATKKPSTKKATSKA